MQADISELKVVVPDAMAASSRWAQYHALTKPKVVVLMLITSLAGMFLATRAGVSWSVLLFGNLGLISAALAAAGLLIILAGLIGKHSANSTNLGITESALIGIVQGLCLPFRGFSRSGATISTGLLLGIARDKAEEFSFALAVVLTPPVIAREILRLLKAQDLASSGQGTHLAGLFLPSIIGMVLSFLSGLLALRWLSNWLEKGRWQFFGYYCLVAAIFVFVLHGSGL